MAHIVEETVTITFSRVFKGDGADGSKPDSLLTEELIATLGSVAQELVGDSVVVEVKN